MNLRTGKAFARFGNDIKIILSANTERYCLSFRNYHVQSRCKTRLAKPNLYAPKQTFVHVYESQNAIGVYGYLLLGIPVATFMLGIWQIQRRKWKLGLIEDLKSRLSRTPVELPENLDDLNSMEYCPVKVRGTFLHEKEFTMGPRSLILDGGSVSTENQTLLSNYDEKRGFCVITPFKLADRDLTILINRGWVPQRLKDQKLRQEEQIGGTVEITGVVRLNEHRPQFIPKNNPKDDLWFYRDLNAMAEKADSAPVYIEMIYDGNGPDFPIGGQTHVRLRNEHVSYILTWFSLSGATAFMWYRNFIQKLPV